MKTVSPGKIFTIALGRQKKYMKLSGLTVYSDVDSFSSNIFHVSAMIINKSEMK